MANIQNLIPIEHLSNEEAKRRGSMGGKASAEARRKKKAIKETINLMLEMPVFNEKMKKQMQDLGFVDEELTNQTALVLALYKRALSGDVMAFNTLADRSGEIVKQKVETTQVPIIKDDID